MKDLSKGQLAYLIIHCILSAIGYVAVIFFIDMMNIRVFGVVLALLFYTGLVVSIFFFIKQRWWVKLIDIVVSLALVVVMIMVSGPITQPLIAATGNTTRTEIVTVEGGQIQGLVNEEGDVEIYAGIPYAKAPVGELRWKEPQDVESWDGIKDCSYFAPRAMQAADNAFVSSFIDVYLEKQWRVNLTSTPNEPMSEDCLYLNVFKPKNVSAGAPVLVFFHGGSLMSGETSNPDYRGEEFAKNGIVFVSVAYRLGVFGYFGLDELKAESPNHTTGNYGLLDQVKSLKWVQDNIAAFGGDKTNVTIAGESAGSSSVSALCTTPLAHGYFKKAIGESSSLAIQVPPHTGRKQSEAIEMGNEIKKEFKVSTLQELRLLPAEELIKTKYENSALSYDDPFVFPKTPYEVYRDGEQNEEILLNGVNLNEADCFLVPQLLLSGQGLTNLKNYKERIEDGFEGDYAQKVLDLYSGKINSNKDADKMFNQVISTRWFVYPHESWSTLAEASGKTVYRYVFTKENGYLGTWHSGEMIYLYGNVKNSAHPYRYDESDLKLSDQMSKYIMNFIKTDNPNYEGAPEWTPWSASTHNIMEFGDNVSMIDDPFAFLYQVMKEYDDYLATKE